MFSIVVFATKKTSMMELESSISFLQLHLAYTIAINAFLLDYENVNRYKMNVWTLSYFYFNI